MGLIEAAAGKLARNIRLHNEQAASEAVLVYALIILMNTAAVIVLALIVSLFTGKTVETLFAIGVFAFLKFFTGGIHLKSSMACTLASSALLATLVHAPFEYENGGVWLNALAIVLYFIYAPSGQIRKGTLPERYVPFLKWGAILLCSTNFIWQSSLLALIIAVQACSLTPAAYRLVMFFERRVL